MEKLVRTPGDHFIKTYSKGEIIMANTILDKLKEKHKDVNGIEKARNISEALAIVNGTPETAAEPIASNIVAASEENTP